MSYRAILIPADADPTWIDVAAAPSGSILDDLWARLGGPCDYEVVHRSIDCHGPGIQLAVYEFSLKNGAPHNHLASNIVGALGFGWHVHGTAIFLGLHGPATVDLTEAQQRFLFGLANVHDGTREGCS